MKNRVFPFISILALLIAMTATTTAFAQSSPGQDVYNPNGEVLDVVQGGGEESTPAPESETTPAEDNAPAPAKQENGSSPSVCSAADGRDASGNAVSYGSSADCATATAASTGELPFTGFEAGLVGLAGLALLGAGFAVRRFTRHDIA